MIEDAHDIHRDSTYNISNPHQRPSFYQYVLVISCLSLCIMSNALATIPGALQAVLEQLNNRFDNLSSSARTLLVSGAALAIILRLCLGDKSSKKRSYVSNLDTVGRRVGIASTIGVDGKYDVIVVGGG